MSVNVSTSNRSRSCVGEKMPSRLNLMFAARLRGSENWSRLKFKQIWSRKLLTDEGLRPANRIPTSGLKPKEFFERDLHRTSASLPSLPWSEFEFKSKFACTFRGEKNTPRPLFAEFSRIRGVQGKSHQSPAHVSMRSRHDLRTCSRISRNYSNFSCIAWLTAFPSSFPKPPAKVCEIVWRWERMRRSSVLNCPRKLWMAQICSSPWLARLLSSMLTKGNSLSSFSKVEFHCATKIAYNSSRGYQSSNWVIESSIAIAVSQCSLCDVWR